MKKIKTIIPSLAIYFVLFVLQALYTGFLSGNIGAGTVSALVDSVLAKALIWGLPAIIIFCIKKEDFAVSPKNFFKVKFPTVHFIVYLCIAIAFLYTVRLLSGKANSFVFFDPMFIVISLSAGVFEELFFRGYLYNRHASLIKPIYAAILNAFLFMAYHFTGILFGLGMEQISVFRIALLTVMGFLLSMMFGKHKNITMNIAFHSIWNFISYMFVVAG